MTASSISHAQLVEALGKLDWHKLSGLFYEAIRPRLVEYEIEGDVIREHQVMLLAFATTQLGAGLGRGQTFIGYIPRPTENEPELSKVERSDDFFEDGVCKVCSVSGFQGEYIHYTYSLKSGICPICDTAIQLT